MLFRQEFLQGIRDGTVGLAFRRWRRPSVRAGGTLLTPVGQLEIVSLTRVDVHDITEADARRAGYRSLAALVHDLNQRDEGDVYRVELGVLRADPRIALRAASTLSADDIQQLRERLQRLDARGTDAWTVKTLEMIRRHPGMRAADLCVLAGQDKQQFKLNVRKLKALGLTESLETGYHLSPRGAAILAARQAPTRNCESDR